MLLRLTFDSAGSSHLARNGVGTPAVSDLRAEVVKVGCWAAVTSPNGIALALLVHCEQRQNKHVAYSALFEHRLWQLSKIPDDPKILV
jgi:hypothetical protein